MMKLSVITVAALAFSGAAFAAGSHSGGHDEMAIGKPGKKAKVTKTILVTMSENEDGKMLFTPSKLSFKEGQTVRLKFHNKGEVKHEFVMDDEQAVMKHKAYMEKFPEMEHDDANAISLEPGEKGEIVWTFGKTGYFTFACLVPGHYESGMHGKLDVDRAVVDNN
jgi:uncharacterized cupredoxin-like copper-binding protein